MVLAEPCAPRGEVEALRYAEAQLRQLLDPCGAPEGAAELLARDRSVAQQVEELLVRCLSAGSGAAERSFTELEALTLVVRLLGAGAGDLLGDEVRPLELRRSWVQEDGSVSRQLRGECAVKAVLGLLNRHSQEFTRGAQPYLWLEALRALRLQLARPPPEAGLPEAWWADQQQRAPSPGAGEAGQPSSGLQRELLHVGMASLHGASAGQLSRRPQVAALGALRSVISGCAACHAHAVQHGGVEVAVDALRAMLRSFGPPVEAAVVACCDLLGLLASGSTWNTMQVAQTGVHRDALELLKRFGQYRGISCNAFVLLGVVVNDSQVVERIMQEGPDKLAVASQARARWPGELQEALGAATTPVSPALLAALETSPWTLALQHRLLKKAGKVVAGGSTPEPNRPQTQSTACPGSLGDTMNSRSLGNTMSQTQENPLASLRSSPSPCSSEDLLIQQFRSDSPASDIAQDLAQGAISEAILAPLSHLGEQAHEAEPEGVVVEISECEADEEETLALIQEIRAIMNSQGDSRPSDLGSRAETVNSQGCFARESYAVAQDFLLPSDHGSRAETVNSRGCSTRESYATAQERQAAVMQCIEAAFDSPCHEPPTRPESTLDSHDYSVRGHEANSVAMDSEAGPAAEAATLTAALADAVC